MGIIRTFINLNFAACKIFDRLALPRYMRIDGNADFAKDMVPSYLRRGLKIYDIGGGRHPFCTVAKKDELNLKIVGLDISRSELDNAPIGAYDETICADIGHVSPTRDGDLVICQAVLEHVLDTESAFLSMSELLKPGGTALIFVPCRNAIFARINIVLPEKLKKDILFSIFPSSREGQGFRSYYNKCTPSDFFRMAKKYDFEIIEERFYFTSGYFSFLFPLYFVWRIWLVIFKIFFGKQASETFSVALRKMK